MISFDLFDNQIYFLVEPAEEDKLTGKIIGYSGDAGKGNNVYNWDMLTRIVKNQNNKPRKCKGRRCNSG